MSQGDQPLIKIGKKIVKHNCYDFIQYYFLDLTPKIVDDRFNQLAV